MKPENLDETAVRLIRAAITGDPPTVNRAVAAYRGNLTAREALDLVGKVAWIAGIFANRLDRAWVDEALTELATIQRQVLEQAQGSRKEAVR